jgi:hypothetical protein
LCFFSILLYACIFCQWKSYHLIWAIAYLDAYRWSSLRWSTWICLVILTYKSNWAGLWSQRQEDEWLTWSIINVIVEGVSYITYRMAIFIVSYICLQNKEKPTSKLTIMVLVTSQPCARCPVSRTSYIFGTGFFF